VSIILEAMRKSDARKEARGPAEDPLARPSSYDPRLVALERGQARRTGRWRRFWVGFLSGGLLLGVGVLLCVAFYYQGKWSPPSGVPNVASSATPSSGPTTAPAAVESPLGAQATARAADVSEESRYALQIADLPRPFEVPAAPPAAATPPAPVIAPPEETPMPLEVEPKRAAKTSATPSARTAKPRADSSGYVLHGIIWDDSQPMAMVNHKAVKRGDRVDGAEVVEVRRSMVILEVDGAEIQLLD
jgi:hypothetical protein